MKRPAAILLRGLFFCWCDLTTAAGIDFDNITSTIGLADYRASFGDGHGPGAVFTDLNNDHYPDLYLMRAWGHLYSNELYLNTAAGGGQRTFIRPDNDAGAGIASKPTGALAADYDNDGDQDLFVVNFDRDNTLLQNQLANTGQFSFVDVTASTDPTPGVADSQFGLRTAQYQGVTLEKGLTGAWGDPDRDGDLDLYVGNHHLYYRAPGLQPGEIPGQRDIFYKNNGDGTFSDETMALGIPGFETATGEYETSIQSYSSSNAVIFADFNNDQWPDLFVTNKVGGPQDRDMLYMNKGADGEGNWLGFETKTYTMPTTFGNRTGGAMGVAVADYDRDGDLDIYMTDWSNPGSYPEGGNNDLWINQLSETGQLDFVHDDDSLPALFSWGTQWEDFDNDGDQDMHVATEANIADFLYENTPSGYVDHSGSTGFIKIANSRGDAAADYNRDGWLDLIVVNIADVEPSFYENKSAAQSPDNHFLTLKLEGDPDLPGQFKSSRDAIGARAYVEADTDGDGEMEVLIREVVSGSSNAASTSSLELEFGLGEATTADVTIAWPSGRETVFSVSADEQLLVKEIGGDYDGDGVADMADIELWKSLFGETVATPGTLADGNGNGIIDGADYSMWLAWTGMSAVSPVFPANTGTPTDLVPEPSSQLLLLSLILVGGSVAAWRAR